MNVYNSPSFRLHQWNSAIDLLALGNQALEQRGEYSLVLLTCLLNKILRSLKIITLLGCLDSLNAVTLLCVNLKAACRGFVLRSHVARDPLGAAHTLEHFVWYVLSSPFRVLELDLWFRFVESIHGRGTRGLSGLG